MDSSNEASVSRKKQLAADARRNRSIVLQRLLADAPGRKFLWDMIAEGHVFTQTVAFGPDGHAAMCFREGEKATALKLFNEIVGKYPQSYLQMTKENASVELEEENDGGPDADS